MHLKSIFQLLHNSEGEVYGLQKSPHSMEKLLADFSAGGLEAQQRKAVCAWLRRHPDRIKDLAESVKRRRENRDRS